MRKRQSSVTIDTHCPVKSIGADSRALRGGWAARGCADNGDTSRAENAVVATTAATTTV
jgi:hypothetical protein